MEQRKATTIHFSSAKIVEKAKARAKEQGRSLSSYIDQLVKADLRKPQ